MLGNVIHFGTSGWRGIIAEDFTFQNVRAVSAAVAHYLKAAERGARVLIGFDTRFLSEHFAAAAAEVVNSHGLRAALCRTAAPTPALSFEIRRSGYGGGINFTASHNPALYNGLKFSTADGAPAALEITRQIESLASRVLDGELPLRGGQSDAEVETSDPRPAYVECLRKKVDLASIGKAKLRLGYDALFGTGTEYLQELFAEFRESPSMIHTHRDVLFGGEGPDPSEKNLAELGHLVKEEGLDLGISTDGDADRFGVMDRDGRFIQPNYILALLLDYLIEVRGLKGGGGRSVATTHLIDAVARHHGVPVYETPVGFKYMGKLIADDKIVLGGEESAGLSIKGHLPEKDGILACLLVAEMAALRGKSLAEQIQDLYRKVGEYHPIRLNFPLNESEWTGLKEKMGREWSLFNTQKVAKTDQTDGLKMILADGSWVLFRMSGTEPLCRCYCEAHSEKALGGLVKAAQKFIFS